MSIKHYLSAAAALAMFAACSDYDPGMSDDVIDLTDAEIETIEEYNANFIARYGTPAEGHTWGFGAKGSEDEMETRMVNSDNNSNQWGVSDGFAYITDIPGYPHVTDNSTSPYNGKYEVKNGNTYSLKTEAELLSTDVPVGDVTEEEILYVSEWFRSHQLTDGGTCPYTDFFVQDISADVDILRYPTWIDGATYTSVEALANRTNMDAGTSYPYDHTNNTYITSATFKLDRLCITDQQTNVIPNNENNYAEIWDHTLNFNNGSTNNNPLDKGAVNSGRTLTHVRSTNNPVDFACHSSDDYTYYKHWHMEHLTFVGPSGKQYDGYYLGFDYECNKESGSITKARDYHYNNWIIKISPSNPNVSDHQWYRIMCEDLGSTDDYDFNDLVYDVYFTGTNGQYTAHIKVQASGGTLPIYVGTYREDSDHEAHQILQGGNARKLNDKLYQPVNVAAGVTANPVEITFEMKDSQGNWLTGDAGTDPDYIPILVTSLDNSRKTASGKNTFVLKTAGTNPTPQKICIPGNTVRWMKERKQIETSYTNFDKWVGQPNEYDFGRPNDWTKVGVNVNSGNLY